MKASEEFPSTPAGGREALVAWLSQTTEKGRWKDCVRAARHSPARAAEVAAWPEGISPALQAVLRRRGMEAPWSHQAEAWLALERGQHTVITTPTASGKSACYSVPLVKMLLEDPHATALLFFPTKALAQDQCAELNALLSSAGLEETAQVYDGDTPQALRRDIRERCRVVLTNPDMLHASILPNHEKWRRFLQSMQLLVVDEMHVYRGVFGSHVANVLRRLRRILARLDATPRVALTSATIANPGELGETLAGAPVTVIDRSGAPEGERWFLLVNPPILNRELQRRMAPTSAARQLVLPMLRRGLGAIVFVRSRQSVETVTRKLRESANKGSTARARGLAERIKGYRGGYLPEERRSIERELRNGTVACVVSTNALELGIDIGALDACVMAGYPGTIASTWQQAGRAGRRRGGGVAVLVAGDDPVDQFLVQHPDFFFASSPEHARLDPDNLRVLADHLKCAAFEIPFGDHEGFGDVPVDLTQEVLAFLAEESRVLTYAEGTWRWSDRSYPAGAISLRAIADENVVIVDTTHAEAKVLGEIDYVGAHLTVYEQAIYQHDARLYEVHRLDLPMRKAYVRRVESEYFTQAIDQTRVFPLDIFQQSGEGTRSGCGEVRVVRHVQGFKKIRFRTFENIGYGEIHLPELETHTTAFWIVFHGDDLHTLGQNETDLAAGLSGLLHAMHTVAVVHLMCDRQDLFAVEGSGDWPLDDAPRPLDGQGSLDAPALYLVDRCPGGTGFSERLHDLRVPLLQHTLSLIDGCDCEAGCPACVGPPPPTGASPRATARSLGALALQRLGVASVEP